MVVDCIKSHGEGVVFVRLQRRRQAWQEDCKAAFKERRRRHHRRWTGEIKEKETLQVPSHLLSALDFNGVETIIPVSHKFCMAPIWTRNG